MAGLTMLLAFACPAVGQVTLKKPAAFVADAANIIDRGTEQKINGWLADLHQQAGAHLLVVTVPSTEGEGIFEFSQRHFDLWQPRGKVDRDKSAMIVLAVADRQVRIHTGYEMESILPDSWCGSLSRRVGKQYFKKGRYENGLLEMTIAAANTIAEAENIQLTGLPKRKSRRQQGTLACGGIVPLIVLILIVSSMSRRRHYGTWGGGGFWGGMLAGHLLGQAMGGRRRSGWGGGGGGFGGGGFGGGGFGGGGFGGGMSGGGGGGAGW
jgi:uncharacterized protein